jgi:diguanylate cyclase (GGDEF)-like protein/PAS domain S-box-containing protein
MAGQGDINGSKHLTRHVLEQVVSCSSEGILLADAQAEGLPVVYANPAYETLTGYTVEELTGHACPLLAPGVDRDPDGMPEFARLRRAVGRSERCEVTLPTLRKDGTAWFSDICVEPLYGAQGEVQYILLRQRPATERSPEVSTVEVGLLERELGRARQKIASLSRTDATTGLLRLEYFRELVRRELGIARREGASVALLCFDVVELDVYRATFGSKAAESCLRMIAAQLSGTLRRASDLSARCGDAGFAAFVRARDEPEARHIAERIAANVRGLGLHNPRGRSGRYVTLRVGVTAGALQADEDADSLISRARASMPADRAPLPAQQAR